AGGRREELIVAIPVAEVKRPPLKERECHASIPIGVAELVSVVEERPANQHAEGWGEHADLREFLREGALQRRDGSRVKSILGGVEDGSANRAALPHLGGRASLHLEIGGIVEGRLARIAVVNEADIQRKAANRRLIAAVDVDLRRAIGSEVDAGAPHAQIELSAGKIDTT